jgi:hypothetical protein
MRRIALSIALAAIALGAFTTPALAEDTRCVGVLSGAHDSVVVPQQASCNLSGATVKGNVRVLRDAILFSSDNRIGGNLTGARPRWVGSLNDLIGGNFSVTGATGPGFEFTGLSVNVFICNARLPDGNIEVKRSRNGTVAVGAPAASCPGNAVTKGNIKVENNFIPPQEALATSGNTVGGNVQVFRNTGPGQKNVLNNVVRQNLQCKRNDQPFLGAPNVAGKAEGQCSATPPGGPRTLTGEILSQHTPFAGMTTGNCSTDPQTGNTSYSFDFAGNAAGPYPGTFTEHIEVTIGPPGAPLPMDPFPDGFLPGGLSEFFAAGQLLSSSSSFTIQSANGEVSGSKTLSGVVPANPTHAGVCAEFTDRPSPAGLVSGVYKDVRAFDLDYEATITTAEGSFSDEGTSRAQGRQARIQGAGGIVSDVNDFGETFQSSLTEPAPAGG